MPTPKMKIKENSHVKQILRLRDIIINQSKLNKKIRNDHKIYM